jgi:hypothetical protein
MIIKILKLAGGAIMGANKASITAINKLNAGVYELELKDNSPKKQRRSNNQNAYYWGVLLVELTRAIDDSYTAEQFHDMLKGLYFGHIPVGNSYIIGGSTANLNTSEMEDYLTMCRNWAYDNLQVIIPKPNEVGIIY